MYMTALPSVGPKERARPSRGRGDDDGAGRSSNNNVGAASAKPWTPSPPKTTLPCARSQPAVVVTSRPHAVVLGLSILTAHNHHISDALKCRTQSSLLAPYRHSARARRVTDRAYNTVQCMNDPIRTKRAFRGHPEPSCGPFMRQPSPWPPISLACRLWVPVGRVG